MHKITYSWQADSGHPAGVVRILSVTKGLTIPREIEGEDTIGCEFKTTSPNLHGRVAYS